MHVSLFGVVWKTFLCFYQWRQSILRCLFRPQCKHKKLSSTETYSLWGIYGGYIFSQPNPLLLLLPCLVKFVWILKKVVHLRDLFSSSFTRTGSPPPQLILNFHLQVADLVLSFRNSCGHSFYLFQILDFQLLERPFVFNIRYLGI